MGSPPPTPRAYSTHGDDTATRTDGHSIVIDPAALDASVSKFRSELDGKSPMELASTLRTAMSDTAAFGSVPNSAHASEQLVTFIDDHVSAMQKMGVSLEDFVARVQAAARLGYETDPATRAEARAAALNQRSIVHRRAN